MPIFISQGRYSQSAIKGMIARPEDRSKAAAKLVRQAGGRLLSHYLTFGEYDFLLVVEAPDESTVAAAVLAAAAGGGITDVRTTLAMSWPDAMKAFETASGLARSFQSAGQGGQVQGEGDGDAGGGRRARGGRGSRGR
jgi:uncharacterized protein with GYD domain